MFDNVCKFLAENFSEDYATWLLGRPVTLTKLSPTKLSLEPIRADSLILEQSEDLVLHLEFQTEPDENMGFRMLDYRIRVYRRFPLKTILRSEIMKESAVYQEILQEGEQRGLLKGEQLGLLKGKLETIPLLTKLGLSIAEIAEELEIDVALVNQFVANQNN